MHLLKGTNISILAQNACDLMYNDISVTQSLCSSVQHTVTQFIATKDNLVHTCCSQRTARRIIQPLLKNALKFPLLRKSQNCLSTSIASTHSSSSCHARCCMISNDQHRRCKDDVAQAIHKAGPTTNPWGPCQCPSPKLPDHAVVGPAVVSKYQTVLLLICCGKRLSVRVGMTPCVTA